MQRFHSSLALTHWFYNCCKSFLLVVTLWGISGNASAQLASCYPTENTTYNVQGYIDTTALAACAKYAASPPPWVNYWVSGTSCGGTRPDGTTGSVNISVICTIKTCPIGKLLNAAGNCVDPPPDTSGKVCVAPTFARYAVSSFTGISAEAACMAYAYSPTPWVDHWLEGNYCKGHRRDNSVGSVSISSSCATCAAGQRYFADVGKCVAITSEPQISGDTKGNGCPPTQCGNPVNPGNGNKVQVEKDLQVDAPLSGLSVIRTYNGSAFSADAAVVRSFGTRWTQGYDISLTAFANTAQVSCYKRADNNKIFCESALVGGSAQSVEVVRPNGKRLQFRSSGGSWTPDGDINDKLLTTFAADGTTALGWTYAPAQGGSTEQFDLNGRLISITARGGAIQKLTYSNGQTNDSSVGRIPTDAPVCSLMQAGAVLPAGHLMCVTDQWGRQVRFGYDTLRRIAIVIDPAGQQTTYGYDGPSGGCAVYNAANRACAANNLTSVTYPDGKTRTYFYNEVAQINAGADCAGAAAIGNGFGSQLNSLTGIVDENSARYATWTYDCLGRATSSQHAGNVEAVTLAYGTVASDGSSTTTVTHKLGLPSSPQNVVRQYNFGRKVGVPKLTAIDQPCIECGNAKSLTYDTNGNISTSTDWNNVQTTFTYDLARNLETGRTEAAGTTVARTTSTEWHANLRLPVKVAMPLRLTTLTYDAAGNLMSRTEQATGDVSGASAFSAMPTGTGRTWTYTYNGLGQLLTVTGPRSDVLDLTTLTYDGSGNLGTITNALGQITSYSNYDAFGRVGTIIEPNGRTTTFTYTMRGWLASSSVSNAGQTETTSYEYNGTGQVTKVVLPDASFISNSYDAAHRLTGVSDSVGNSITYLLDLTGNRIAERINDPSGTLVRQVSRAFDTFNRLTQQTGAGQ